MDLREFDGQGSQPLVGHRAHRVQGAVKAALAAVFLLCFSTGAAAREPVVAREFMVSAAHSLAAHTGYDVLARGGSAVDAAIAVQMVLGLVEPESSGIGGGAFLLQWSQREQKVRSYDGREIAPAAARPDRFMRDGKPMGFMEAVVGGRSVGVPGVLRMLELAHQKHGRLKWADLFQPAIKLAEEGFPLSPRLYAVLQEEQFLRKDPAALRIYYGKAVGERIVNPEYAATLRALATRGASAMYEGPIAADMVRAVRSKNGDLTEADMRGYRAMERDPVCGTYRIWRLCSMGPPSSGGVSVLQILGILERAHFAEAPAQSAQAVHYFSEAGRLAYADRARYLGDPAFNSIPVAKLLSPDYLDKRAKLIGERSMRRAMPGDFESGTSHFSIVEANGDAVAMTTTIESGFGSRIMVHGFLLNNELTDFDFTPGGPNEVGGGKRPRSSMAPTMVFNQKGELELLMGSPGGSQIINFVAKALVGVLDWKLNVQDAIDLPNFGSRNGPTQIERGSRYEALIPALTERGHDIRLSEMESGLHGIERVPGGWRGGADSRREGVALGR
ncbi:MAG: gamma-glutamyltransferase [Betaproteobacteria bacterium]|nr:gamma-glutamyltransferase [Betaproteobacteria bacterium]